MKEIITGGIYTKIAVIQVLAVQEDELVMVFNPNGNKRDIWEIPLDVFKDTYKLEEDEEVEEGSWWMDAFNIGANIAKAVTVAHPVANVLITGVQAIVNKENDSISDNSVINVLTEMSKSQGNSVDDEMIEGFKLLMKAKEVF